MIVVTVFLSILNQMELHLVQNRKENCYHDHIPFNVKGIGNIVFSEYSLQLYCNKLSSTETLMQFKHFFLHSNLDRNGFVMFLLLCKDPTSLLTRCALHNYKILIDYKDKIYVRYYRVLVCSC